MNRSLTPIGYQRVRIGGGLLGRRQALNAQVTAPLLMARCEQTGRVDSLHCQKDSGRKPHPFWDSDIGKVVEAIAYTLPQHPNPVLKQKIDAIVQLLADHQWQDGYLNSYYTATEPENRWTNLYYMHELYCAGHLIEGAVAYYEATGERAFLDVMCGYADHIALRFGAPDARGYCGHPEIELALVRLYRVTGNAQYLALSKAFIDRRGTKPYFFEIESLARGVDTEKTANQKRHLKYYLKSRGPYAEYQAHMPVRAQREPVGHAVRAMYLYSGMADIAACCGDDQLLDACRALWDATTQTQYAITGGIGPSSDGERFTFAYDLPNEITYNETCASVAMVMWAWRMLQIEAHAKYADILEQTLYNTVLGSVSADGTEFFYANYVSVNPPRYHHASAALIDKMRARRQPWFDVSCCPPNASRLIGSIGGYMASAFGDGICVHQYFSGQIAFDGPGGGGALELSTDYPWDGDIRIQMRCQRDWDGEVRLRIPGWCARYALNVNGQAWEYPVRSGYALVRRTWRDGDAIRLELEMAPRFMEAHPSVREDCGKVALMRGPVVYCLEQADNGPALSDLTIDTRAPVLEARRVIAGEPCVALTARGWRRNWQNGGLYRALDAERADAAMTLIPYYLWANRGEGEMTVWMNKA